MFLLASARGIPPQAKLKSSITHSLSRKSQLCVSRTSLRHGGSIGFSLCAPGTPIVDAQTLSQFQTPETPHRALLQNTARFL
jgi:hypothetical protein